MKTLAELIKEVENHNKRFEEINNLMRATKGNIKIEHAIEAQNISLELLGILTEYLSQDFKTILMIN